MSKETHGETRLLAVEIEGGIKGQVAEDARGAEEEATGTDSSGQRPIRRETLGRGLHGEFQDAVPREAFDPSHMGPGRLCNRSGRV